VEELAAPGQAEAGPGAHVDGVDQVLKFFVLKVVHSDLRVLRRLDVQLGRLQGEASYEVVLSVVTSYQVACLVLVDLQKLAYGGAGEEGRCTVVRALGPVAHVEDPAHQLVFS
jgi:hypothetical protein